MMMTDSKVYIMLESPKKVEKKAFSNSRFIVSVRMIKLSLLVVLMASSIQLVLLILFFVRDVLG